MLPVGDLRHLRLGGVQLGHALVNHAEAVAQGQVLHAQVQQMFGNGNARGARTVQHHPRRADFPPGDLQRAQEGRGHHHSGTVLIVMEDGNVAHLLELLLNLEAPGGGDVLQVDAAKAARQQRHRADDLVHVLAADAQGEGVHVGKGLEQRALALHHGHTGLRADVAQAQHGGAVGDHGHQVGPAGQLVGLVHIRMDDHAGLGHAGGIAQGQIPPVVHRRAGHNLDLALPFIVLLQRFFTDGHASASIVLFVVRAYGNSLPFSGEFVHT